MHNSSFSLSNGHNITSLIANPQERNRDCFNTTQMNAYASLSI